MPGHMANLTFINDLATKDALENVEKMYNSVINRGK